MSTRWRPIALRSPWMGVGRMRSHGLPVYAHLCLVRHMAGLHLNDQQRHDCNSLRVLVAELLEGVHRHCRRCCPCWARNSILRISRGHMKPRGHPCNTLRNDRPSSIQLVPHVLDGNVPPQYFVHLISTPHCIANILIQQIYTGRILRINYTRFSKPLSVGIPVTLPQQYTI